jgi:hypothetical protein
MHLPPSDLIVVDFSTFQDSLDLMGDLVDDVVLFGVSLVDALLTGPVPDFQSTAALMLRNMVEQLDGVGALVRANRVDPGKALMRVAFEAALNLSYLTATDRERRANHYRVANIHRMLKMEALTDPSTIAGRTRREAIRSDTSIVRPEFGESIAAPLEEMLRMRIMEEAERDWQERARRGKPLPPWYSLTGGPSNLADLATHLGRDAQYYLLYRMWSAVVHSEGLLEKVRPGPGGSAQIPLLRYPADLQMLTYIAVATASTAYKEIVERLLPEKAAALTAFHFQIRPRYTKVGDPDQPLIKIRPPS